MLQVLDEHTPDSVRQRPKLRYIPRVAVLVLICGLGGAISNVGAILALFGGMANACVTFVLPVVFHMMLFNDWKWLSKQAALHIAIIVFSSVAALLATLGALEDLLRGGE